MRTRPIPLALLAGLALLVAACGSGSRSSGDAAGSRTIDVDMRDNTYSPDRLTIRRGRDRW